MFLICITGIDGCGKTTQAQLLLKVLKKEGFDAQYVWLRWEPSLRIVFSFIKSVLWNFKKKSIWSKNELENFQHSGWVFLKAKIFSFRILKWLWWNYACADYYFTSRKPFRKINSEVVIVDRYLLDFLIDQASNLEVKSTDTQKLLDNFFLKRFRFPNLNILIDLPASEGYTRKLDGTSLDYLKDREKSYSETQPTEDTLHVNGLNTIDVISNEISQWVLKKLRSLIA